MRSNTNLIECCISDAEEVSCVRVRDHSRSGTFGGRTAHRRGGGIECGLSAIVRIIFSWH